MPGGTSSSYFRVGDNVELWRVVVYLCVLIAMVMVLEQIMHRTEHALKKYPKYHEMLSKIYRELMILGLLGLGIKFVKELALVDGYGKNIMAFQVADLIVFISAFALIIQAIGVFSLMRSKNKQMDRDELVSSYDLIELVTRHQILLRSQSWLRRLWPWTKAPASGVGIEGSKVTFSTARYDEMVTIRTLRHFFLRKYGLPELFPFSKYLRQAQDHQITHMIDIEMSMWILLILLTWALDASTQLLEGLHHELERYALVTMFIVFAWALTFLHFAVSQYLRSSVKRILAAVGYKSHKDMLEILRMIAAHEERNLELQKADNALEMMQHVQEEQESKEHGHGHGGGHGEGHGGGGHEEGGHGGSCMDHDTGFQVVAAICRSLCGKKKEEDHDHAHEHRRGEHAPEPLPEVKIRFFSRVGLHFVVKFLIMLNGFYFAFMCQAVLYEMPDIFTKFGVLAAIMVPTPLIINMFFFQPQICRNYVLVSCIFKVDVATLSEVVTHFSESVELRSDFVTCLKQSMREHGLGMEELHAEFLSRDPAKTGYVELEVLRQVLRAFGCQISFFRFNGIAKLLFRLKGTRVEYSQIERLLALAEQEDLCSSKVARSTTAGNQYPRYLSTVIAEETEVQHRERFSVASSRYSEDIVMLESENFSRKKHIQHHQPSQEHTVQVTGRFGLPRFSAQQPALPTTMERTEMDSPPRTARDGGGLPSMKGGHGYHEVEYPHTKFFVRSFFSDYYDYITTAFAGTKARGVTVFGPPGVGTSVFLAYFFLRYQLQHPTTTFVFVWYDRGSHVRQVLVWKNGAVVKKLLSSQAKHLEDEFADDPDTIFLLDGTPKRLPHSQHRHLVCSNQSKALATENSTNLSHGEIYVPLWEVDELKTAIDALGLDGELGEMDDIDVFPRSAETRHQDELEYRFDVFGGVARPCLETDTEFVDTLQWNLKRHAASVDLMTGNRTRSRRDYCEEVSDHLFHCYPSSGLHRPGYVMSSKLKMASPYVTQLLATLVDAMHPVERAYFEWKGRWKEPVAAFQQSRVAQRMLEELKSGVELVANSLAHGLVDFQFDLKLSIQPSAPTTLRPSRRSFTSALAGGPCFVLQGNGIESIEALYLIKSEEMQACTPWGRVEAVVFLASSTFNYRVPAKSLLSLLQQLSLADVEGCKRPHCP